MIDVIKAIGGIVLIALWFGFLLIPAMGSGGFNQGDFPGILLTIGIFAAIGIAWDYIEKRRSRR